MYVCMYVSCVYVLLGFTLQVVMQLNFCLVITKSCMYLFTCPIDFVGFVNYWGLQVVIKL
jgi:hypothetical protein